MEVHWNSETKTYSVGATIPQLDEYDTDKEIEKSSEENSTSDEESEEELKEPGPSVNQQICLTLITQSLKASPTVTSMDSD